MNDERFLRDWLRDTTDSISNPNAAADKVVANIPDTPQRRRWLPWLPSRRRKPDEPNRRIRFMFKPVSSILVGALTVTTVGALLVAQPFTTQTESIPSATLTLDAPVEFTARFSPGLSLRMPIYTDGDDAYEERGAAWAPNIVEMSEPMLDGSLIYMEDTIRYRDGSATSLSTITYRIENDNGAWQGTAIEPNQLGRTYTDIVVLVGEGDYAGLYAVMRQSNGNVEGVIYPAPPPEPSDLP